MLHVAFEDLFSICNFLRVFSDTVCNAVDGWIVPLRIPDDFTNSCCLCNIDCFPFDVKRHFTFMSAILGIKSSVRQRSVRNSPLRRSNYDTVSIATPILYVYDAKESRCLWGSRQEAQLPQRNSASAAHIEGASLSPPPPPLATPMRTVESETRNKRTCTSSVPSVKRTLSWIGHSRSFKVILICADRNPERCIVVMSN